MKISKKQIEYAIEALRANNIITNDNQYPKVFKGYISLRLEQLSSNPA